MMRQFMMWFFEFPDVTSNMNVEEEGGESEGRC